MDVIQNIKDQAKKQVKTIVLPEGLEGRVIRAAAQLKDENIAR